MRNLFCAARAILAAGIAWLASINACADKVDEFVAAQMQEHDITGVSLGIIEGGKISKAQGYGFTDKSRHAPVTTSTL